MTEIAAAQSQPELRLRTHVEATLASARVPRHVRDDLAEELYGHLWTRWQEARTSGQADQAAADSAIRSFGSAQRLGVEMTGAYHSRLYASTAGVLLATAAGSPDRPAGLGRLQALLLIPMFGAIAVGAGELGSLTPGRAVLTLIGIAAAVSMSLASCLAIGRGQRWALRYAQILLFLALAFAVDTLVSLPPNTYQLPLAGLLGLYCLGPALGADMKTWTAASRPLGKLLSPLVALTIAAGLSLPFAAPILPDPSQVGPGNLDLQLTAACTRDTSGYVTAIDLTTGFRWDRLDLLPNGIKGGLKTLIGRSTDGDGLLYGVLPGAGSHVDEYSGKWLDPPPSDFSRVTWPGGNATRQELQDNGAVVDSWQWSGPEPQLSQTMHRFDYADVETISTSLLQAGHQYYLRQRLVPASFSGSSGDRDPLVFVRYQHLDRFAVEARATCERPGTGVPVAIPQIEVPT
jgi:hypothetical protein